MATQVLFAHKDQKAKEMVEAASIKQENDTCVSHPSVHLIEAEYAYLQKNM